MNNDEGCQEVILAWWDEIKMIWQNIKEEIVNASLAMAESEAIRITWQPMMDNTRKSQVMNRKPMVTYIRNTI